jgi:heme-binding NEAT domain protein
MKKRSTLILAVITVLAMIFSMAIPTFAASAPTEDGTYEVTVKMMHAEKDKTSMGNKYLVQTGLLTVKDGSKTLTIATAEDVDGMQFWYYKNGGVEGDTVEVKSSGKTKIAGTTYANAYTFPVKSSGSYVGVKFAAPGMPLSPSARIYIDYSSAKLVSGSKSSKSDDKSKADDDKDADRDDNTKSADKDAEDKASDDKNADDKDAEDKDAEDTGDVAEDNAEAKSDTEEAAETASGSKKTAIVWVAVCFAVAGVAIIVVLAVKEKKGKKE